MTPDEAIAIVKKRYPPEKIMSYGHGPLLEEVLVEEIERLRAATPVIRLLDWQETFCDRGDGSSEPDGWESDSGFGSFYTIKMYYGTDSNGWIVKYAGDIIGDFDDPERAKEFAQSDFIGMVRNVIEVGA